MTAAATIPDAAPRAVALVTPGWPPELSSNGIVSYAATLRRALRATGVRVVIVSPAVPEDHDEPDVVAVRKSDLRPSLRDRLALRLGRGASPEIVLARSLGEAIRREIERLHREAGVELVEVEESFGWCRHVLAASPVPVVVRLHGPWFLNGAANGAAPDAAFRRRDRQEREGLAAARAVTAPTRDVLERTRAHLGLPLAGAAVIANPVDPVAPEDRWRADAADPRRVLFVGRFDRHKGGDVVLRAFREVLDAVPDARLAFVGLDRGVRDDDGRTWPIRSYLERALPDPDRRARVEWLDWQPPEAIRALRRACGVCVVASRYEVFGIAAAEALAQGCPLVSTPAGGLAEVVRARETALCAPPGDAGALAARIVELLRDRDLAARLGAAAARDAAARFAPDVLARQTLEFYRTLVDERSGARAPAEAVAGSR